MHLLRTGRNITIIALILSLLFHVSSVFYIFWQKTRNDFLSQTESPHLDPLIREENQEQQKHTPWVETKARAGNFGAPVFFEDIAEDIPQDAQETLPMEQTQTLKEPYQETPLEENTTTTPQDSPQIELPAHPEKKQPAHTQMATAPKNSTPKTSSKRTTAPQKNPFINYPTRENKQKPSLTLAQLTQGFLNQRKEDSGSYGISMLGMKHGLPSDEQMKYERYLQKLCWCIQNSFRINRRKQPAFVIKTNPHVFFALNRDGILQNLSIRKSSGNILADEYILFIFRDASSSFPPVPNYLTDDPFTMTFAII